MSTTVPTTEIEATSRFRTARSQTGTVVMLSMAGEVGLDSTDMVSRALEETHAEAQRIKATEVTLDLTQLEFLNSSGIKHFVSWLRIVSELPAEAAYRIRLISSPLVPWQRRSLSALRCFAPNLLTIDTVTTA